MQDVMDLNLVDEGGGQLVTRWVHSDRHKRLRLIPHSLILEDEVLTRKLTLTCHVVPQTDRIVISGASCNDRSLDGHIKACD